MFEGRRALNEEISPVWQAIFSRLSYDPSDVDSDTYYCYDIDMSSTTRDDSQDRIVGEEGEDGFPIGSGVATSNAARMSLGELTDAARVSVRTVRYYIAEGLLPPPEGTGPGSAYTQGHLDRLRLIQRLKEAYLPLKEIRRRLSGLGDEDVRRMLADEERREQSIPSSGSAMSYDESLSGARDYLALLESRERYQTEPMALQFSSSSGPMAAAQPEPGPSPEPIRNPAPRAAAVTPGQNRASPAESSSSQTSGLWHRIPLGDEAELVISDRVYARHRDRIDWLVRWGRKVFG
jgi:DNA-binding transcriptional MerR regulator